MTRGDDQEAQPEPWPNLRRLGLSLGFLALAVGILAAWNSPAEGYEVSIYASTPRLFWFGVAIALGASALICSVYPRDRVAFYSLGLGILGILSIAALPMIRSYGYLGAGDAMTHLGYAEDIRSGVAGPQEFLYPGGHSAAVLVAEGFGLPTERAMLLWTFVLLGVFLVFVPVLARAIIDEPVVTVIAGFSAFLLLPFNNVSTYYQFHTYSLGVMALPVLGYILVKFLQSQPSERWASLGGWNVLLIAVGIAMLLLHPQVMLNVVILLGTFVVVHFFSTRSPDHPLARLRSPVIPFVVLTLVWFVWSVQHWQLFAAGEHLLEAAYGTVLGEQTAGQTAADAGASSGEAGGSLTELFLKLFLVAAVYSLMAASVVVTAILATRRKQYRQDYSVITYVGYGGFVLTPFFLLHFLGDISTYFFRHLGFAMVFATVLGAIGLHYLGRRIAGPGGSVSLRVIGVWLLAAALVLSVPIVFASPYIFLPNSQVSHGEMDGYETAFEITDDDLPWSGVRAGPGRFFDGLTPGSRPLRASHNSAAAGENLTAQAAGDTESDLYLPISQRDYHREVTAYNEIRFEDEAFETVERSPQTNHVLSNGDFDLYYVRAAD